MQVFYTVRPGDTLYNIANRWSIPLTALIKANNIPSPFNIYIGQQLSMPPGVVTYVVKPGDSLYLIAQRYGIPSSVIANANGLTPPYTIMVGQTLLVPPGVPLYVVAPGDTLYKIAQRYNVTINGQPRPDLIINENPGLTPNIMPGMRIIIPYAPPGGPGRLAILLNDSIKFYLGLLEASTGRFNPIALNEADASSTLYWSPDQRRIAFTGTSNTIFIFDLTTMKTSRVDQTVKPYFIDWSPDSRRIVYSTGNAIKIYDVLSNTSNTINRKDVLYPQWFPNGNELLYEAKDANGISQLYRSSTNGSNEVQLTRNTEWPLNYVRLSPNGRYVLYTSPGASISEIYTIELSTGKVNKIPGGPEAKNYNPTWSPDSSKIAYSSTQFINGKYYSLIRVSGPKGEGDSTLAIGSCYATPITWSPDSRKVAYLSWCRDEFPPVEIWSVDVNTMLTTLVLSEYVFYNLDWSPTRN